MRGFVILVPASIGSAVIHSHPVFFCIFNDIASSPLIYPLIANVLSAFVIFHHRPCPTILIIRSHVPKEGHEFNLRLTKGRSVRSGTVTGLLVFPPLETQLTCNGICTLDLERVLTNIGPREDPSGQSLLSPAADLHPSRHMVQPRVGNGLKGTRTRQSSISLGS